MTRIAFDSQHALEKVAESRRCIGRSLCDGAVLVGDAVELQPFTQSDDAFVLDVLRSCTVTDKAGNENSASVSYTVVFQFSGFFQPVDNLPVINRAKAGSAVPVKFSLIGNQGLDIFAASYPTWHAVACTTGAPVDVIEETLSCAWKYVEVRHRDEPLLVRLDDDQHVDRMSATQASIPDGTEQDDFGF